MYKKFCPNVFVAQCEQEYTKGDTIAMTTKYGKEHEAIVFNLVGKNSTHFFYSVVRADGFDRQAWAQRRAERLNGAAANAAKKSLQYREAANEGRDFLVLGEPIKVGHHSEKRHRALIERNHARLNNWVKYEKVAETYEQRAEYWEAKANEINLSMPESLGYYEFKLEEARRKHQDLKDNPEKREHSFSLTYAKKYVNEAQKNFDIAKHLWGEK
jgi:hypothetical protein